METSTSAQHKTVCDGKRMKLAASQPTKWAIATAGYISTDFAISLSMLSMEKHKLVAIASRSKERSENFAKKFGVSRVYASYEELAGDNDIDVVYIGIIPTMHHQLCKLFLESGHNVVCEIPFTMNMKELKEVIHLAREKNLFLMENNQTTFCPAYIELTKELAAGNIGEPRFVSSDIGVDLRSRAELEWTEIKGGGYGFHFTLKVFGNEKPVKVTANGISGGKDGGPDLVNVVLTYSNNRMAVLNICSSLFLSNEIVVSGSGGSSGTRLKMDYLYCPEKLSYSGKESQTFTIPKSDTFTTSFPKGESLMYMAEAVRECLLQGLKEHPQLTLEDCVQKMEIMDEIRKQIGLVYDAD